MGARTSRKLPTRTGAEVYSRELSDRVFADIATGMTLNEACSKPGMPSKDSVRRWVLHNVDGCAARHDEARMLMALSWADEIITISDDATNDWMDRHTKHGNVERVVDHEHIARSKLRTDNRRWLVGKLIPALYGDRVVLEGNPDKPLVEGPMDYRRAAKAILEALGKAGAMAALEGRALPPPIADEATVAEATGDT